MATTVVGLLGVVSVALLVVFSSGQIGYFWNPMGMGIVLGGTVAATLIAFRGSQLGAMITAFGALFQRERAIDEDIARIIDIARVYHGSDIQAAEKAIAKLDNPFLRLGLQFAVDGTPTDDIMHILSWRIQKLSEREAAEAKLFRMLAAFAPAFGMLGTLVGLIGMLGGLGSGDLELIGRDMSVALITTVYGLMLANMVFKPIAIRMEQRTARRVQMMNVLLEGVILLRLGRGPTVIGDQMRTLIETYRDEIHEHGTRAVA